MLITARKKLIEALAPAYDNDRVIKRCIRRGGIWYVYYV